MKASVFSSCLLASAVEWLGCSSGASGFRMSLLALISPMSDSFPRAHVGPADLWLLTLPESEWDDSSHTPLQWKCTCRCFDDAVSVTEWGAEQTLPFWISRCSVCGSPPEQTLTSLSPAGMSLPAFAEAFFYLAQRRFKAQPLREQVRALLELCEAQLKGKTSGERRVPPYAPPPPAPPAATHGAPDSQTTQALQPALSTTVETWTGPARSPGVCPSQTSYVAAFRRAVASPRTRTLLFKYNPLAWAVHRFSGQQTFPANASEHTEDNKAFILPSYLKNFFFFAGFISCLL